MKRFLSVLSILILCSACTEIEFGSHIAKQIMPPTQSQGSFKVGNPYKIDGQSYTPQESYTLVETGIASWYGPGFHGKLTANGETFDMNELTAAHRTLQMPSLVRVTNLENGRSLIVRVNDRGPFKRGRVIDLSKRAAELLDFKNQGTAKVRLEVLREESLAVAQVAKSGQSTRGYEVALNRGQPIPQKASSSSPAVMQTASASSPPMAQPQPSIPSGAQAGVGRPASVQSETLVTQGADDAYRTAIPGHTRNGAFYPDPIITEMPVQPSSIFVQAGSFSVQDNADKLAQSLSSYVTNARVHPAIINGQQFYRVRVGPVGSVAEADEILSRVVNAGNRSAIIIVE